MPREPSDAPVPDAPRLDRIEVTVGRGAALVATAWDPARHPPRATDRTATEVIEVMRAGSFRLRCPRGAGIGDACTAVLFAADEEFEVDHPVSRPNLGVSLRLASEVLDEWWPAIPRARSRGLALEVRTPAAASLEAHALGRHIARGETSPLELGSRMVALLRALAPLRVESTLPTGRAAARARDRVQHLRASLAAHLDAAPSLDGLAREVDWTPWHLAHQFTRLSGASLHAYARALRLRAALAGLGTTPIGELAHAHGFASHSHLSAWFRREFGMTPTRAMEVLG